MVEPQIINEEYYVQILKEAEQIIEGVSENIQEATLSQYTKVVKRLNLARQTPIKAASSKGTYYTYRAAWIGYHANHIRMQLYFIDNLYITDYQRWKKEVEALKYFIRQLMICKPDPKRNERQLAIEYDQAIEAGLTPNFEYSNEWRKKSAQDKIEKTQNSKKALTRKLPIGWRDKFFQAALDKHSKHTLAIAVMICSGCRPKELENGINLKFNAKTGEIKFLITSAKRKNETVKIRQFTLKNDSMAFRYLVSQLNFNQKNILLRDIKFKAVSTEITRLSKKALNLKKEEISPYCFRHAFSGDLHAVGSSRVEIAQCLGHATDKTQSYYSHSIKHATGGFKISNIDSTDEVTELTQDRIEGLLNKMNLNNEESEAVNNSM